MARTPFRDRPIKQKLRIVTLIIIFIMGLIAISGDVAKEYFALHSEANKKMAALSTVIAQASVAGITFNNAKEAEKELALLMTVQNITSAAIYLADGTEFAVYKRKDTDEKEFADFFYNDLHSLSQPILLDGKALGRLEVKWELQEEYKKLLWYVLMVVTLTFIFAPLISLFLIERLMQTIIRPIAVLSSSAAEIGKGNLYHKVAITSKDEIGQLAASFNRMTEDLRTTSVSMELLIREVGERQRVEEVLKNKDAEWQNTFDSISDFVSIHTLDFRFIKINKVLAAFLGVTPEEAVGRPCYELYHSLVGPINDCPAHAMLESLQSETREVYDPGRGLSLLITASPVFDRNGEMIASVHMVKDITERKKMEEALQVSEARFRHLSEATFESVAISESGRILDTNNSFIEMLGYEKLEEVVGRNALEFTAPESHELVAKHIAAGYEKPYEAALMRKDGSVILAEIRGRMMEISGGRRLRFTAIRDITERKRAEEALRRSEENLNRAQAIGRIGSWLINIPSNRLEWSAETYRMFGIPQQDAIDLETFFTTAHHEDRDFVRKAWGEAVAGAPYDIEHRIVVKGETLWVRERAEIERDSEGRAITGIGTVQDITERKLAEEDLKKTVEDMELYRLIIEKTGDPVFMIDDDDGCRMIYVNEAAIKHYKASREEIYTWRIPDWDLNFTYEKLSAHVEEIKKLKNLSIESAHRVKSGEIVPVEISLNLINYKGHTCHFGYFKNITERIRVEKEKTAHIRYLTSVNHIYNAFESALDLKTALSVALNKLLSIFDCDRAWLLYPLDADAKTYKIPFEQTKPEYPGAFTADKELPVTKEVAEIFRTALNASASVSMNLVEGITDESQLKEFDIKTQLVAPLYPKTGKPWMIGLHQCSRVREWTEEDQALFYAISLVISDKLNNILLARNLSESESRFREIFNTISDCRLSRLLTPFPQVKLTPCFT